MVPASPASWVGITSCDRRFCVSNGRYHDSQPAVEAGRNNDEFAEGGFGRSYRSSRCSVSLQHRMPITFDVLLSPQPALCLYNEERVLGLAGCRSEPRPPVVTAI